MPGNTYSLAIYPPLGVEPRARRDVGLDADVTSLAWSCALPLGYGQLQLAVARTLVIDGRPTRFSALPEAVELAPFNHVELWRGAMLLFEGRMMPTSWPSGGGTVNGYWDLLDDQIFTSDDTTLSSSGAVLRTVLANAAPLVRAGAGLDWVDPGKGHAPAEFDGLTPRQVLDALAAEGDPLGDPLDWLFVPGRTLALRARSRPATPDYRLSFDPARVRWQSDPSTLYGAVLVEYTAVAAGSATIGSGTTSVVVPHALGLAPAPQEITLTPTQLPPNNPGTVAVTAITSSQFTVVCQTDPGGDLILSWQVRIERARTPRTTEAGLGFTARYGVQRTRLIPSAGELTTAQALAVRDAALVQAQEPTIRATLTLAWEDELTGPHGEPRPAWSAQVGAWVQLGDRPPLIVVAGSWDANARTVSLDLGERRLSVDNIVRRVRADIRSLTAGINPATGGRT